MSGIRLRLVLPMVALVLALGFITSWLLRTSSAERLKSVRERQERAVAEKLAGRVATVVKMIELEAEQFSKDKDLPELQRELLDKVRALNSRPSASDYFWVHTFDPDDPHANTMIMHSLLPELEGVEITGYETIERLSTVLHEGELKSLQDPEVAGVLEHYPFYRMNTLCFESNGGTLVYFWPKPTKDGVTEEAYPKMSYVGYYEPWNWVIGTGEYIDHIDALVQAEHQAIKEREGRLFLTFSTALAIALICGLAASNITSLALSRAHNRLAQQLERNEEISAELEAQNIELQTALEEVKTLTGLLPICAYCKKIRDDDGYWNQMEEYITKRSDAMFSHGICPECLEKNFPQNPRSDGQTST